MKRFLLAAAAFAIALPAYAFDIGIGGGTVGAGAISGSQTQAGSAVTGGGGSTLLGITRGRISAGQTSAALGMAGGQASCQGPDCTALAEHQGQNETVGSVRNRTGSLGIAGTVQAGQTSGISNGLNIGSGQAEYTFGSIFARP